MTDIIRTSGQLSPVLKQLRKAKGWSQIELGKRIGLSQERISVIENHPEKTSVDQLLTVLMALEAELQVGLRQPVSVNESPDTKTTGKRKTKPLESW
ncbi:MAG: helix-turn-helix domain-containing protein [Sideroxyarcus sp.]|nr:helix-turn-helix domain-containing protein [Sideroxyarcus sp.]